MESTGHSDDDEIARAKASLMARMEELGKRFQHAKRKLDIEAHIASHPLVAAGIALAAGLLLGSHGGHRAPQFVLGNGAETPTPPAAAASAPARGIVATLAIAAVKELVLSQASRYAKAFLHPPKS